MKTIPTYMTAINETPPEAQPLWWVGAYAVLNSCSTCRYSVTRKHRNVDRRGFGGLETYTTRE